MHTRARGSSVWDTRSSKLSEGREEAVIAGRFLRATGESRAEGSTATVTRRRN